ncbi:hypothetical protein RB195_005168 [Necator americanus]|uniref:Uncharacterized protein n=1 Tax=Necator americanus TaxID=51031 RepID=A0ABR1BPZ3_NECAM
MTKPCTLFSLIKSLWLRTTGQPGWCNCIICRDEMLNQPDPLGFSEDARKFQKKLRKMPKAYKCKPCMLSEDHFEEDGEPCCAANPRDHRSSPPVRSEPAHNASTPRAKGTKTVSFSIPLERHHPVSEKDSALTNCSDGYTYIHDSKMVEETEEKRETEQKKNENATRPILSRLETIIGTSTSSSQRFPEIGQELPYYDETEYSLYEAKPPLKFPIPASQLYHDDDSMRSYGTITSQEILDAFEKASEVNNF